MKYKRDATVTYYYNDSTEVESCIHDMCRLAEKSPLLLEPFKGSDEKSVSLIREQLPLDSSNSENRKLPFSCDRVPVLSVGGMVMFPTVEKTTLFYHSKSDCFFKILHPLSLKYKLASYLASRAGSIYELSRNLLAKGIKVPRIYAYGMFTKGRKAFYVMERIRGSSLYDLMVTKNETLPEHMYYKVIDTLSSLHKLGYWFGDLRVAHIFIHEGEISGFVDIDGIKLNVPFRMKNIAKDLAGLNQPGLPIAKDEKKALLDYYISQSNITNRQGLLRLVRHYSERRWGE